MYDKETQSYLLSLPKTTSTINELVELNSGLMFDVMKRLHVQFDQDAKSIAYEALYKTILTYDSSSSKFSTYAYINIFNALGSYIRQKKTAKARSTISYETKINASKTIADTMSYDAALDDSEMVKAIYQCITKVRNSFTNVLHIAIVDAWVGSEFTLTQTQMAVKIGCSQVYVGHVLKHFKKRLEAALHE